MVNVDSNLCLKIRAVVDASKQWKWMTAGRTCWWTLLLAFGIVLHPLGSIPLAGQSSPALPGESQLPGAAAPAEQLPGEDTLPGQDETQASALPGEDVLPGQAQPVTQPPSGDGDGLDPVGDSPPLLRLGFDGHTGLIRTMDISDGGRTLVSAGEDKDVHVWRRTDLGGTGWLHRRTIRWPVGRGPRGLIYSARLKGDLAAFAGHGAFGFLGEIRIVDVASGEMVQLLADEQSGHRQTVTSLAWSPEEKPRLASVDMEGRLILWSPDATTGLWRGLTWVKVDAQTYSPEIAVALQTGQRRAFVPVTFAGPRYVIVPRYVKPNTIPPGFASWHLHRIDLQEPSKSILLTNMDHATHVRCLSATDDGRVLASCDMGDESGGHVGVWRFAADGSIQSFHQVKPETPPVVVDLDSQGKRLLVGTEPYGGKPAQVQIWDIAGGQPKLLSERTTNQVVYAAVLDDDHREALISQGNDIEIFPYDNEGKLQDPRRLTVPAKPIRNIAFSKEEGSYRVAMGWNQDAEGNDRFEAVFDLSESKLLGRAPINADDYLPAQRTASRWQVAVNEAGTFQLYEGDQPRGVLPLLTDRHGGPTTLCTLPVARTGAEDPEERQRPSTGAVVVGTRGGGIYVYRADASNPPVLLRQFRGHTGEVHSLSSSADGNYLVSGSADATLAVWNLQDIYRATPSVNRWGCDFDVEGNQLIAANVREDGPLHFRGVRDGDRLVLMDWLDYEGKSYAESDPDAMRARLLDLPFDIMPHLKFTRMNRPGPDFQSFPAWRPIATLFVDQEREWAFWTPAGYYDASFNGHQRFGWQINNRSVDRPVEYFRAAQFRKLLERPDIMRRLLAAGSLPAAMRRTLSQIGPSPADSAIVNQIESKPTIRLLEPHPGAVITGNDLVVEAEIDVPRGASLVPPKAFISGVPPVSVESLPVRDAEEVATSGIERTRVRWNFRLPSDPVLQLEILAATESEALERVLVNLDHDLGDVPRRKPRLHVIALGISRYQDPQIQSLDFAAKAADEVAKLFDSYSAEIYQTTSDRLVDEDATRPLWRVFAQSAVEQLSTTVSPDDLVILYLCGHGLCDRRTNQWYFVTADARFRDLMSDQYADCLAFSDLAALAQLPCRKLAILDSCHSGAVQPVMRRDDLKSALRFLQDDVVLTLTASEGDEEAAEQREAGLGRFTAALACALKGSATESDSDPTTVSLTEVIQYVSRRVADESAQENFSQHPTASPAYLLPTLKLPLTKRSGEPVDCP